jgi:hypothetical protein
MKGLYGAPADDDMPMDDMPMDSEPSAEYEPKDDEERAYVEAFPDNAWDENRMAAMKEGVRLCVEKNAGGEYSEPEPPSKSKGGSGLALIFGEPKKKR